MKPWLNTNIGTLVDFKSALEAIVNMINLKVLSFNLIRWLKITNKQFFFFFPVDIFVYGP